MAHLKQLLDTINVTYTEKIFESENGIAGLGTEPFVSDYRTKAIWIIYGYAINLVIPSHPQDPNIRMFIIVTYAVHARPLLCEVPLTL